MVGERRGSINVDDAVNDIKKRDSKKRDSKKRDSKNKDGEHNAPALFDMRGSTSSGRNIFTPNWWDG